MKIVMAAMVAKVFPRVNGHYKSLPVQHLRINLVQLKLSVMDALPDARFSKELLMTRMLLRLPTPLPKHAADSDAALLLALKRLPRAVRQVFLLSRLDQLAQARVATRLGLPLRSVERLMVQALLAVQPRPDAPTRQAAQWYVRLQSPDVTACERIDFRRWLDASPNHLQAFHATELYWRSLYEPALALGRDGWYRKGRAALALGGCSFAAALGMAVLIMLGLWA